LKLRVGRGAATSSKARKPRFVSPSTTRAALYIGGILSSRQTCSFSTPCTFAWTANSGTQTFAAEVDDGDGGHVLAEGSAPYTLNPGENGSLAALVVNGVAATIGGFSSPETPTGPHTLSGTFAIADYDGNAITNTGGSTAFDNGSPTFTSSAPSVGTVTISPTLTPDALGTDYAYSATCKPGQTGTFTIVGTTGPASGAVSTANLTANGNLTYPPAAMGGAAYSYACATGAISDASGTIPIGMTLPNLFVADTNNNAVEEILATGGEYTTVNSLAYNGPSGQQFANPTGVAVDASGNVFVADEENNAVKEITVASGYTAVNTLGYGFNSPTGVALDSSGNVYVADCGNSAVKEITADNGYAGVNTLGSGFTCPVGVAVDTSRNVFVVDVFNHSVKEILAASGYSTIQSLGSGLLDPFGVAVDGSDNVYVADTNNAAVKEILAAGGYTTIRTLGSGFTFGFPYGVAIDASGNVDVADTSDGILTILAADDFTTVITLYDGPGLYTPEGLAVH
jgi:streptogramin lyase